MKTHKVCTGHWQVLKDQAVLADITLDADWQAAGLTLRTADPAERHEIKALVASHMWEFCRSRTKGLPLLEAFHREDLSLTEADSDRLMSFDAIKGRFRRAPEALLDQVLSLFVRVEDAAAAAAVS